jgi:hypothetical protein
MPPGAGILAVQSLAAAPTLPGLERHDPIDAVNRQQHPLMGFMTRLAARLPSRTAALDRSDHRRRIRRGRAGRILGVLAELSHQLFNLRPLLGDDPAQLLDYDKRFVQRAGAQVRW